MFKALRWKFIALNMGTVLAVLIASFSVICYLDYTRDVQYVHEQLTLAIDDARDSAALLSNIFEGKTSENQQGDAESSQPNAAGKAPSAGGNSSTSKTPSAGDDFSFSENSSMPAPPIVGKKSSKVTIPVAVYFMDQNGTMKLDSVSSTATMDEAAQANISYELLSLTNNQEPGTIASGRLDEYNVFYTQANTEFGIIVAFADTAYAEGWKDLALVLVLVGIAALGIFFVINLFFSNWALRPLKESWDQQKRFIADASHDLKTPLTVIAANQSILLDQSDATIGSMSKWIESTQTEAQNMQNLISDMLLLAKHDEHVSHSVQEPIDLSLLIEGSVLEFESVAYERNITIDAHVEGGLNLCGDSSRISRLVSTLLDNACKYASSHIEVRLIAKPHLAVLEVENDGTPLSAEEQDLIFERFYRGDTARSNPSSHGLGLAIARAIAQDHQGNLVAEGVETGTVFRATLPTTN